MLREKIFIGLLSTSELMYMIEQNNGKDAIKTLSFQPSLSESRNP